MAVEFQIVFWRDIPAQIRVRAEGERLSRQLSQRFQVAIDEAAMQTGSTDAKDYLEDWHTSEWQMRSGDLDSVADELVAELESEYSSAVVRQLIQQGGHKRNAG